MNSFEYHQGACPAYEKTKLAFPRIFDDYSIGQILKRGLVLQGHSGDEQGEPGDETRSHADITGFNVLS